MINWGGLGIKISIDTMNWGKPGQRTPCCVDSSGNFRNQPPVGRYKKMMATRSRMVTLNL